MRMDLLARGVAEDIVARALEEETETEPEALIQKILEKKQFNPQTATHRVKRYGFVWTEFLICFAAAFLLFTPGACISCKTRKNA